MEDSDSPEVMDQTSVDTAGVSPGGIAESDWTSQYNDAVEKSWMHSLSASEFISEWSGLMEIVEVTSNPQDRFFDCCQNGIEHYPYTACSQKSYWTYFLKQFYSKISTSPELYYNVKVMETIALAKNICAASWTRAYMFWKLHHAAIKDLKLDKDKYIETSLREYKEQFSSSYANMDVDYEKFKSWAKAENLPQEEIISVQKVFMKEGADEEQNYPYQEPKADAANPNLFMKWVDNMESNEKLLVRCEEVLCQWPENASFYVAYLAVMDKIMANKPYPDHCKRRLYYLTKRGLGGIADKQDGMFEHFIELSLNLVARFLDKEEVSELIQLNLTCFQIQNWNQFIASRRVISSIEFHHILKKGKKDSQKNVDRLHNYVAEMKGGMLTGDFMMLALQLISYEQKYKSLSLASACELFNSAFKHTNDPNKHLAYLDFIRSTGDVTLTDDSYKASIVSVEKDLYTSDGNVQLFRLGYMQLLRNYISFKYVHGSLTEQAELIIKLARRTLDFGATYNESYWLPPNIDHIESHQVYCKEQQTHGVNQEEQSYHTDTEVTARLNEVQMDESEQDLRIFLSNIDFKVKDPEIKAAFQMKDINVVNISLKKNKQGQSEGYGTVQVKTKEEQNLALFLNRIMIGKREAFISRFEDKKKSGTNKTRSVPRPTTLLISASADEPKTELWATTTKLQSILEPFGHIKYIEFSNKINETESLVMAKVEFHMSEDAQNAYVQWKNNVIFQDIPVTMRIGFVKKKADIEPRRPRPMSSVKNVEKRKMDVEEVDVGAGGDSGIPPLGSARFLPEGIVMPPTKKTARMSTSFIPHQLKRKTNLRKPKLNVKATAQNPETSMDQDHEDQAEKKSLSNDDFRNLMTKKN